MWSVLLTLIITDLLAAMSPGPDFAIVMQNTLMHSRRAGILTALGVAVSVLIHVTYCLFGLAVIIHHAHGLFDLISCVGGIYLIYLGAGSLRTPVKKQLSSEVAFKKTQQLKRVSFRQGFFTNLLNPKCILFFIAMFSYVPMAQMTWYFAVAVELCIGLTTFFWFASLSFILTHPLLEKKLERITPFIVKLTGLVLCVLGCFLAVSGSFNLLHKL